MTHVEEAIERLKKFGRLCKIAKIVPILGFSGGKDSAVVYDLAKRSGIEFIPRFNHTFEPPEVLKFIKEVYPEVEWFRGRNVGFLENIRVNHKGYLPTAYTAYCCDEYKHNSKFAPKAVINGVRRVESLKRRKRNVLNIKSTKHPLRLGVNLLDYFSSQCISQGSPSELTLSPIVDWTTEEVMEYVKIHDLPLPKGHENGERVGCIICPKAGFKRNVKILFKYPKLINAVLKTALRDRQNFIIREKDLSDDKILYVCLWLNSFHSFSKKEEKLYNAFRRYYEKRFGTNSN